MIAIGDSTAFAVFILTIFSVGWIGVAALGASMVGATSSRLLVATLVSLAMFPFIEDGGPSPAIVSLNVIAVAVALIAARRHGPARSVIGAVATAFIAHIAVLFVLQDAAGDVLGVVQGVGGIAATMWMLALWARRRALATALVAGAVIGASILLPGDLLPTAVVTALVGAAGSHLLTAQRRDVGTESTTS